MSLSPIIEGHTWCACECFRYSKVVEAKSKVKLKLTFQNHHCVDNYDDDLLLPGVQNLPPIILKEDHVFRVMSPPLVKVESRVAYFKTSKPEQKDNANHTPKAKIIYIDKAEVLKPTCEHKTCVPGQCFKILLQRRRN